MLTNKELGVLTAAREQNKDVIKLMKGKAMNTLEMTLVIVAQNTINAINAMLAENDERAKADAIKTQHWTAPVPPYPELTDVIEYQRQVAAAPYPVYIPPPPTGYLTPQPSMQPVDVNGKPWPSK